MTECLLSPPVRHRQPNCGALNIQTYSLNTRPFTVEGLTKPRPIKQRGRQTEPTAEHLLSISILAGGAGDGGGTWRLTLGVPSLSLRQLREQLAVKWTACWSQDCGRGASTSWVKGRQDASQVRCELSSTVGGATHFCWGGHLLPEHRPPAVHVKLLTKLTVAKACLDRVSTLSSPPLYVFSESL